MGKAARNFADWRLQENLREYNFYFKNYKKLIMNMFKWKNLPDGISSRFIEDKLFSNGLLIFFKSKMGFYVVTQATPIGLNGYEEPIGYRAYSINGINEYVKPNDCVPLWNDMFIEPSTGNVNFFAKRLSNIIKTIDINLEQLKNPFIVSCPDAQKNSVEQVFKQKTEGVPYIVVNEDFQRLVGVNVFNLDIKDNTKSLTEVKNEVMNEGLTFFGINNVNVLKRERLITGEAEQNDEQITINRDSMLEARKNAVEAINKKFNLNIELHLSNEPKEDKKDLEGVDNE